MTDNRKAEETSVDNTDPRPARPVPEGVTIISSGAVEVEVPTDEFEERGEYIAELIAYIEQIVPKLAPLKDGLPHHADSFLLPAQAAAYLAEAAEELSVEMTTQGSGALLINNNVLAEASGVSKTTVNRRLQNQPRIDGGRYSRSQTWRRYDYQDKLPDLPKPPELKEPETFYRHPRVIN